VDVTSAEDETVWYQSFQQNQLIDLLSKQASNATQFVVFDACRNELHLSSSAAKAIGADKGFVPVADTAGLLIAYATAPNRTASDAGEAGGPYAKALAEELLKPGVEAVTMFRNVQIRVKQAIGQDPWLSFPSLAPVYLAGWDAGSGQEIIPQPQPSLSEAARGAWAEIKDLKDVAVFEAFRKQYGAANALYETLAAQKIVELKRRQVAVVAPQKPVLSEDGCDGLRVTVALSNEKPCLKPGSGESFKDCADCPEMVIAPSGSFTMGSPEDEPERSVREGPQHKVTIPKPFAVGKFAVTFAEWDACVAAGGCGGYKPNDAGWGRGDRPVIYVSWDEAKAYTAWLSKQTGATYRLLSEAEREYAARAGTTTPFWWGSAITPEQANYNSSADPYNGGGEKGEYRRKTVPVNSFKPNPWGLDQVHGNVWEWVEDCWHNNYSGAPADGSAWTTGKCEFRVVRGGSLSNVPHLLRAAYLSATFHVYRNDNNGFRVARTLNP